MTDDTPHSLLLDPRVTHLLITRDGATWTADMTVDGFRSDCTGFKTSADAYWWAYEEVSLRDRVLKAGTDIWKSCCDPFYG